LSYWQDVICENLLKMHIDSANETHFHGQIAKYGFGPLKANFISVRLAPRLAPRTGGSRRTSHQGHQRLGKHTRIRARQSNADIRRVFRLASSGNLRTDRCDVGVGVGSVATCA